VSEVALAIQILLTTCTHSTDLGITHYQGVH